MAFVLFDDEYSDQLLPLTYGCPAGALRIGIWTIAEKWKYELKQTFSFATRDYLQAKFPLKPEAVSVWINGRLLPNPMIIEGVESLELDEGLFRNDVLLAAKLSPKNVKLMIDGGELQLKGSYEWTDDCELIEKPYHLFQWNAKQLKRDFGLATADKQSAELHESCLLIGPASNLYIHPTAKVRAATINVEGGPVYIGPHAEVMEGSVVRGSLALCEHAVLKLASKVYGGTTLGPHCKVGGEVNNVLLQGYSNKGHDGFLGNSVIGSWCNLGADTNSSNLKNNYSIVKTWNIESGTMESTDEQFCGLIMGDHSKTGINTMLNTGTVVGFCSNIYGGDFPPKYVPAFSWGSSAEFTAFKVEKACEVAERMMERRGIPFTVEDRAIFESLFEHTQQERQRFH